MAVFAKDNVSVTYGSRKAENGRWRPCVIKRDGDAVYDLSPSETFLWRSTAYRKAKAAARAKINLIIPPSTPESRSKTATEIIGRCFSEPQQFIAMWRQEFQQFAIGETGGTT